jgi:hypothetical protein
MAGAENGDSGEALRVEVDPPRHWDRRKRDIGNMIWISFLMAAAATMVFFAMVDPLVLSGMTSPGWEISRQTGYAIGFFMFWLLTASTCFLSFFMARTDHRARDIPGLEQRLHQGEKPGESSR